MYMYMTLITSCVNSLRTCIQEGGSQLLSVNLVLLACEKCLQENILVANYYLR